MTIVSEEEVEAAAEAIYRRESDESDPDYNPWDGPKSFRWKDHYRGLARAALEAAAKVRERQANDDSK